ncbi:preprotein translocase subunit SecG [Sphingomonas sp. BK580]|uniref:preprotein translocase subunit SecG n=1 Tax=Sphingomonas sp. BK580 TaxID=2586972 RepID=UPI001618DF6A|nr:preprotein translocase subunit SecG [Sphingomonas sp. BK580]MBB3692958.1 preprotein translocase subunit SecG [Sphingomonas sp. BK580]
MFTFLLVVQAIIAAALVTVILMQRSEGGGLTSSGSPSGLMSARGAADFLTRATSVLAGIFVVMSIVLAFIAAHRGAVSVDTSLQRRVPAAQTQQPAPTQPDAAAQVPLAGGPANAAAPAPAPADNGVPLAR